MFKIAFAGGLLLITVFFVLPADYQHRIGSIFTLEEKEGSSSSARIQILKDSFEVFKAYPLGVGVHGFPSVRQAMFGKSQDTHNLYLEILTNLGVQGLIAFLLLIYALFKQLSKVINAANRCTWTAQPGYAFNDRTQLITALCLAVKGYLITRLILGVFGMDLYEIYWWFALGLTAALTHIVYTQDPSAFASVRRKMGHWRKNPKLRTT